MSKEIPHMNQSGDNGNSKVNQGWVHPNPHVPSPAELCALPALEAAPLLLGYTLVRRTEEGDIRCRIVETESYGGMEDKGSHAYGGRKTGRTEVMFRNGGLAYIYLIYGMYHCLNVVTGREGDPQAVLIRAVEPLSGQDLAIMRNNRSTPLRRERDISSGPGKLCRALRIDRSLNASSLLVPGQPLWLEPPRELSEWKIMTAPRVNIDYAAEYAEKPWRFFIGGHPYISVTDPRAVPL
ncbi:DNA-3-methyladenine glycosylase [Paenibacillus sp. JX-17]|uniref:Putative 3-methyladenine DNA glycosylase n=1 Tax=Paenibacillus lacisoli TaxID=3064525 RepID=A0ABT9CJ80_9BACL|nr:DNA-3-methyladenine glycosylase [Paenibacillus sp. JX-17]MDO7908679.1 DNA-3-methyladenine glycosylase [Paenibacillus sp. JX-17]